MHATYIYHSAGEIFFFKNVVQYSSKKSDQKLTR